MKWNQITIEKGLLVLVVVLAVTVRFYNLGTEPLSDGEASRALQALSIAGGQPVSIGADTGYTTLTGLAFFLAGSTSFLARLLPALAGCLLVLGVFLFRNKLGAAATLILMLGLALDPGMVATSRLVGSPMLGLGFGLAALGLIYAGQPVWAGFFAGLAILGGPGLINGILGLGLGWLVSRLLTRARIVPDSEGPAEPVEPWLSRQGWLAVLLSAGITVLLVGTLFFRFPQGLSGWASTLPAYWSGWVTPSGVPALRLAGVLVIYQPLALFFGLIGAVRGWLRGSRLAQTLTLWLLFSSILALIYPARQVADLTWALLPLWALAAIELAEDLTAARGKWVVWGGLAVLVFLIMALIWLNLAGMDKTFEVLQGVDLRLGVLAGLVALAAIATVLVGFGWSWSSARAGLAWGVCAALGLYGVSMMWNAAHVIFPGRYDLWEPSPSTQNADLLVKTVGDLSEWHTGLRLAIDVSLAVDSPSLRWALRDYGKLAVLPEGAVVQAAGSPAIVITRKTQNTSELHQLAQSYRGQDFPWWTSPGWQGAMPPDFLRWLTTHEAPLTQEPVILWARSDLFPAVGTQSNSTQPGLSPGAGESP